MPAARTRHIDRLSVAMALLPLVAIAFDAWGILYYRQGLRNEAMNFGPGALTIAIVLSFAIAGLLVRGYALTKRGDPRVTFCWLLVPFVLMAWPAMCAMRPTPIEIYRRGLVDWARVNVDVNQIRAWHATMTPASLPTQVSPGEELPRYVVQLSPSVIERHPTGVLLQWGDVGRLPGRQRKLFVGVDGSTPPPAEGRRFWVEVQPGVYVGTHDP